MFRKRKFGKKEFAKFYDENVEKIYRFIFLKVSSKEAAEDLTSQTFLNFWERIAETKTSPGSPGSKIKEPRAFLYRIARNLLIDFYRRRKKEPILNEDAMAALADEGADTEYKIVLASDAIEVKNALSKIKPEYSEAIILHYLDDLSISDVARILERPEGTVRVMLHRGLEELRNTINNSPGL